MAEETSCFQSQLSYPPTGRHDSDEKAHLNKNVS